MPLRAVSILCSTAILLLPRVASAAEAPYVEGEVLVTFKAGTEKAGAGKALGRHALKLNRHYGRISRHSGRAIGLVKSKGLSTAKLIERLKADPEVETVEPNYYRYPCATVPNDTDFSKLWGLQNTGQSVNGIPGTSGVDTNFVAAWQLARSSSAEVVVGVVDTGVDITHPDLAANIWTNPGEIPGNGIDDDGNGYVDDVHGYDFGVGTAAITDDVDHGTHVAGTIGAVGRNGAGVIGVQYRAKILPLKIADAFGGLSTSAIIDACEYAVDLKQNGVNIVALNASYGSTFSSSGERTAIEALRDNGILLCAAAGNGGEDSIGDNNDSLKFYPASYSTSNIIAVASINSSDALATSSNYGAITVDLAAPGVNVYSTLPQHLAGTVSSVTAGGAGYASQQLQYSGTTTSVGISGTVYHCGLGNPGDFPPAVAGNIALIQRGTLTFAEKVTNAMNAGAAAAIIYDNIDQSLAVSGGWTLGSQGSWIPAIQVTKASGEAILAALPASGTVSNIPDPNLIYQYSNGTSMATPHVAGAVAFAAWNFPNESPSQIKARILSNVTPVAALAGKMTSGGRLNLLKMVDTDADGLPDWWENENYGSLATTASGGDSDGDGFSDLDEFLAGTDPNDPTSYLAFSGASAVTAGPQTHFVLSFPSVLDRSYRIEWSDTLQGGSWQPLGSPVTGTGGMLQVQDTDVVQSAARRFYRMSALKD